MGEPVSGLVTCSIASTTDASPRSAASYASAAIQFLKMYFGFACAISSCETIPNGRDSVSQGEGSR